MEWQRRLRAVARRYFLARLERSLAHVFAFIRCDASSNIFDGFGSVAARCSKQLEIGDIGGFLDMNLKYSQFNLVDEIKAGIYSIYNTKSRFHLILNLTQYSSHATLLNQSESIKQLPEAMVKKLRDKGFIVQADIDEVSDLKWQSFVSRFEEDHGLVLTILPTLECNFKCAYCFEDILQHKNTRVMIEETQENIVHFVERKLSQGIRGALYVKWFGGEPLLALDTMLSMTKKLKAVASRFNNRYISAMLTNGYLLDQVSKQQIDALSIFAIQVTLDGPEAEHNKRRPHRGGGNSFKRIIENLKHLVTIVERSYIRINTDKTNAASIPVLLKYLNEQGLLARCKYDIGYIDTETGAYTFGQTCSALLNEADIRSIYASISKGLCELNLENIEPAEYPKLLKFACDAQIKEAFIIDPSGNVYKCLNDATIPARAMFNLNSGAEIDRKREEKFLNIDPYQIKACQLCSYLPICHGGCPAKLIDLGEEQGNCWPNHYVFRDKLIKYAKRKFG